jgi:hypothetical protein
MQKRSTIIVLSILMSCASPQFVGTPPGELSEKVRVLRATEDIKLVTLDGEGLNIRGREFFIAPGRHNITAAYGNMIHRSLGDSSAEFSAKAGETVLICKAAEIDQRTRKGVWTIFTLVSMDPIPVSKIAYGEQDPTCQVWADILEGAVHSINYDILRGASKTFRNANGLSVVEFARSLSQDTAVAKLLAEGFK